MAYSAMSATYRLLRGPQGQKDTPSPSSLTNSPALLDRHAAKEESSWLFLTSTYRQSARQPHKRIHCYTSSTTKTRLCLFP